MTTVILLNGVGSVGKSSIAKALQAMTRTPFLHVAMDDFIAMLPARFADHPDAFAFRAVGSETAPQVSIITGPVGKRLIRGIRRAIAALAEAGNDIVVDEVLLGEGAEDYRALLAGFDLKFVGVVAPLEVIEAREKQRGDRLLGLARWQFDRVHVGIDYDFVVDSSTASAESCAGLIRDRFDL